MVALGKSRELVPWCWR